MWFIWEWILLLVCEWNFAGANARRGDLFWSIEMSLSGGSNLSGSEYSNSLYLHEHVIHVSPNQQPNESNFHTTTSFLLSFSFKSSVVIHGHVNSTHRPMSVRGPIYCFILLLYKYIYIIGCVKEPSRANLKCPSNHLFIITQGPICLYGSLFIPY